MLDGVCRQVDLQRGRVRVRPVAVGALVGFILVVLALVGLRGQRESGGDRGDPVPPAPGPPTLTWRLESWVKAFSQPGCGHL